MLGDELIRRARAATTIDEAADVLRDVLRLKRAIEWLQADVAAEIVAGKPRQFVREAAKEGHMGHRYLYSLAGYAARTPEQERDPWLALHKQGRTP